MIKTLHYADMVRAEVTLERYDVVETARKLADIAKDFIASDVVFEDGIDGEGRVAHQGRVTITFVKTTPKFTEVGA